MSYLSWHYLKCNRFLFRVWGNYLLAVWHFFSIGPLFQNLLAPWRRVMEQKTELGFSLEEFFSRLAFNLFSRVIGFLVRLFLIVWGLLAEIMMFFLGWVVLLAWQFFMPLSLPLYFWWQASLKPNLKKKEEFIRQRSEPGETKPEDREAVGLWFEKLEAEKGRKRRFWEKENLLHGPGLGWNFAFGYTPELDKYVTDMTLPTPFFHQLVGREKEVAKIEEVLARSGQNNVLLVGEPGVGKKAIVLGFAKKVSSGKIRPELAHKRVLNLDMNRVVGERSLSEAKNQLLNLLLEAESAGNVILVIENIDKFCASRGDSVDMTDVFAKVAGSFRLQLIGITIPEAYYQKLNFNDQFLKLFEKLDVAAPSPAEALSILMEKVPFFEEDKKIKISYQALTEAVKLSERLITDLPFPEKAIDLLDEAISKYSGQKSLITVGDIDQLVAEKLKVPVGATLIAGEKEKLKNLELKLHERVADQEQAILVLASALRRARLQVSNRSKPVGSFLFLGPTGVGKTETAKALAAVYFGSEKRMVRFDMSQYQEQKSLDSLIGSPDQGAGLLTEKVKDSPFSVLLLDELEKADRKLINIFLSVLDEGYFQDFRGKKVSFTDTIIIATSNAAAEFIREKVKEGLRQDQLQSAVVEHIQKEGWFSPEFVNRFDAVVVFKPLGEGELLQIAKLQLADLAKRLKERDIELLADEALIKSVAQESYSLEFGARPMKRWIADKIEDEIAKALLAEVIKSGDKISLKWDEGKNEYRLETSQT